MFSGSARKMRRVLEQIKDFARHSKLAHQTEELSGQTTCFGLNKEHFLFRSNLKLNFLLI